MTSDSVKVDVGRFERWIAGVCDGALQQIKERTKGQSSQLDEGTVFEEPRETLHLQSSTKESSVEEALTIASEWQITPVSAPTPKQVCS